MTDLPALLLLLMGHALADFYLQSDAMAKGKNRHREPVGIPPGQKPQRIWPYWLSAHALIHGAAVFVVTVSISAALIEVGVHWLTDFGKCENWYGIHFDQLIHVATKVLIWVWLL